MKEELNFIDRFLYKFIICLILLLGVVLLDKISLINIQKLQVEMQQHLNFLPVLKAINGDKGVLLPIDISDEVSASASAMYQNYQEIKNGKRITLKSMQGVEVYKTGIVVKIIQNSNATFQVTLKGVDDYEYIYDNLETIDVNIYKLVKSGDIIGSPSSNYFDFFVYDKTQVVMKP